MSTKLLYKKSLSTKGNEVRLCGFFLSPSSFVLDPTVMKVAFLAFLLLLTYHSSKIPFVTALLLFSSHSQIDPKVAFPRRAQPKVRINWSLTLLEGNDYVLCR